jgi:outer membrane protein TolC
VANVINAYYTLVADDEDLKAKNSSQTVAQDFLNENKKRVDLGALAQLDVTTAESLLAASQQDLVISQTNFRQHELQLKNLLSRTGNADPLLAAARIVPMDRIVMPAHDDLPAASELVQRALANRSDLAAENANIHTAEVSALGTKNGILPTVIAFGGTSQAGLAGTVRNVPGQMPANPYFVGGLGTAMGQVLRRNFPSERVGVFSSAPIQNRLAQSDYGVDQLSLRQQQLSTQKDLNQVQVDVANALVAMQQSRARYEAAVQNRILEQKLFDAERRKFDLGASTPYNVVVQQRDLATAQATELNALVSYNNARVSLDQTTGTVLEANHVSLAEARSGKAAKPPVPPVPPAQ